VYYIFKGSKKNVWIGQESSGTFKFKKSDNQACYAMQIFFNAI